ncbi:hypothetical protein ACFL13_00815 [Patescibacteria group bacterium]
MQRAKEIDFRKVISLTLFCILFLVTRIPELATDSVNPDAVNWHYRSQQFMVGLKTRQFEKTFQHYHPGVTLMWVAGTGIEVVKQVTGMDTYTHLNFTLFHFAAKFMLVFAQIFLSILLIYWLSRSFNNFYKSLFIIALFTFEPFFVGNSRMFHMDVLFTLLIFGALITAFNKNYLLSAILTSFTFLTRSIGLGVFLYVLGMAVLKKESPKKMFLYIFTFLLTTFVFFPALWVKPVDTISEIFSEGERVGVRKGHSQIFFGEYTRDPGVVFYPIVTALKTSPFLWVGLVAYLTYLLRPSKDRKLKSGFILYLGLFYIGYFLVMTWPSKKLDRYMLTLWPLLATLAVVGFWKIFNKKNVWLLAFLYVPFVIYPLIKNFPYYFTYTSIPANMANNIVGQKPFGVGIFELREYILDNYGQVKLGFIDTKPMKAIYPNSRVFDMRVDGTSNYDLVILAINEEFPEDVLKSGVQFTKDGMVSINGLNYWTIYVKEN